MNDLVVKNVDFCNAQLLAVQDNETGKIYAGINCILRELGFDDRQIEYRRNKWNDDKTISKGVRKFLYPSENRGNQETYCIDIKKLPIALAKIEITPKMEKEMPELSGKLEKYQDECADILAEAFLPKADKKETKTESLDSVNEAAKILMPYLIEAGVDSKIQLLTIKSIYSKAGINLPFQIESDKQYYDTEYIARKAGIHVKSSGKPAEKAVNEIIRRLNISDDMYTETWETNGKWQGTVRKYSQEVIDMVKEWRAENDYPSDIEYTQTDGKNKKYHVKWKEVA